LFWLGLLIVARSRLRRKLPGVARHELV
jgi:hypothetical protein